MNSVKIVPMVMPPTSTRPIEFRAAARNSIGLVLVGGMTIGTIFTLFIVPSLYMLIAKQHHEKSLMDVGWEDTPEDVDLSPELAPALAPDGNGNGWKK